MFSPNCVQFIIAFIFTLIPVILSQCYLEVNQCLNQFSADLEQHKKHQFSSNESQFNDICDHSNGIYSKFVVCITGAEGLCSSDQHFRQYVCESRKLKMRVNRFNWKPTFFFQLCRNTSHDLSLGFIQHEECISGVLNTRNWKCDVNYDKPIKNMRDWKNNINTTCSLWRKFRDCSRNDVKQKCGSDAATIADQLFHSHQSYFEKYYTCELEGTHSDQCWYDLKPNKHSPSVATTQPAIITTTTTTTTQSSRTVEDMTDNSIDGKSPARSEEMRATDPTMKDLSADDGREGTIADTAMTGQSWIGSHNNSKLRLTDNDKSADETTDYSITDTLDKNSDPSSGDSDPNHKDTDQLMYTSGATTDSIAEKYLLIFPVILIVFIKCFV